MPRWNPWHGCHKISEGCKNCYVYRIDSYHGKDSSIISKTRDFNLPVRRSRNRSYKIPGGSIVFTCFTSDFFLEEADQWRAQAWEMMKNRNDLEFFIITKRIQRLPEMLPKDWGAKYDHITICCTVENQKRADERLPVYKELPLKNKIIVCAPLLEPLDLSAHLGAWVDEVSVGGESGQKARPCDYDWILNLRRQCVKNDIPFQFMQTGTYFIKDGKKYKIDKKLQHKQAAKADINFNALSKYQK